MLDYVSYFDWETFSGRIGKTKHVGKAFSCVATQVFYDCRKKKNYLEKFYSKQIVEKGGVHYWRINAMRGEPLEKENEKGQFIVNEYAISDLDQMLPLYGLTLKRNEYFAIWVDRNFSCQNQYSNFLKILKTAVIP